MCGWGLSLDSIILILGILEAILKVFVKKFGTRTSAVKNWLTGSLNLTPYDKKPGAGQGPSDFPPEIVYPGSPAT